ncbi:MAG: hypothetical protein M3Y82_06675, partial [Verrucomicrobiota bacterium]|nr:hypothetical protein [Verrucomicrobiota bacterium]
QLNDSDYSKRNSAVMNLSSNPNEALPLLEIKLKTETNSNQRWWLKVAIRECADKRLKPGEISASPDHSNGLQACEASKDGEGAFSIVERDGIRCWLLPKKASYLYFTASDEFREKAYANLELQLEFLDIGTTEIFLEYNSSNPQAPFGGAYEGHPKRIRRTNSGQWRKARFYLSNALFRGLQNQHSDFRFHNGGEDMIVRAVRIWPSTAND